MMKLLLFLLTVIIAILAIGLIKGIKEREIDKV
jgi:hypothetical protein